jgi:hypothetical protein
VGLLVLGWGEHPEGAVQVQSSRCSKTMRTAPALNSAVIFFGMTSSSWTQKETASNP